MQVIRSTPALLFTVLFSSIASASATPDGRPRIALQLARGEQEPAAGGFFKRNEVAFWEATKPKPKDAGNTESLWAEPMRLPDGRMTVYVPPKPVLDFLDHPTRESARQYLAWQTERMKKLKVAVELLAEVRAQEPSPMRTAQAPTVQEAPPAKGASKAIEILYFKKADCGFCDQEDKELAQLANTGAVPVTPVPEGDARWKQFGITATPSFIVTRADGSRTLVRGFMPAEQLAKLMGEAARDHR
jgi:hypothetical protein